MSPKPPPTATAGAVAGGAEEAAPRGNDDDDDDDGGGGGGGGGGGIIAAPIWLAMIASSMSFSTATSLSKSCLDRTQQSEMEGMRRRMTKPPMTISAMPAPGDHCEVDDSACEKYCS